MKDNQARQSVKALEEHMKRLSFAVSSLQIHDDYLQRYINKMSENVDADVQAFGTAEGAMEARISAQISALQAQIDSKVGTTFTAADALDFHQTLDKLTAYRTPTQSGVLPNAYPNPNPVPVDQQGATPQPTDGGALPNPQTPPSSGQGTTSTAGATTSPPTGQSQDPALGGNVNTPSTALTDQGSPPVATDGQNNALSGVDTTTPPSVSTPTL